MINGVSYIRKMMMALPTQEELLAILSYDPTTGHLTWKDRGNGPGLSFRKGKRAGNMRQDGYIHVGIRKKQYYAHRVIWCMQTGDWPTLQIDHRNLNRADNSWRNLRLSTPSQNKANIRALNALGIKGVTREPNGKYRARIGVGGADIYLGVFTTIEAAKDAYNTAAKEYFGEFARGA